MFFTSLFLIYTFVLYPQSWVQTPSTPQGAGVTDMVFVESNQSLFVTTFAFNWPTGQKGGIRRSTDDGATWVNLYDAYVARTIILGPDGNLYASIWPYPSPEGLYRSTDNGNSWGSPLITVPSGNNIFSIALNPTTNPYTIFAGTRNGLLRSMDNGTNWTASSNGIPPNSWVRDIEVDSGGIIAAATTNGLFISTNNGDSWEMASGINDTVVKLLFDYPLSNFKEVEETRLLAGSNSGSIYEAFENSRYLTHTLLLLFSDYPEISSFGKWVLAGLNLKLHGVTTFPQNGDQGGGYYESTDNGNTWTKKNEGLPEKPKSSALAGGIIGQKSSPIIKQFIGLLENTNGGARIFKRETIVSVKEEEKVFPDSYTLYQNYPNPFNPLTTIKFALPKESFVKLEIFDALGQKVSTIVSEILSSGIYEYEWDAKEYSSGVYTCRLSAENFVSSKKLLLMK